MDEGILYQATLFLVPLKISGHTNMASGVQPRNTHGQPSLADNPAASKQLIRRGSISMTNGDFENLRNPLSCGLEDLRL